MKTATKIVSTFVLGAAIVTGVTAYAHRSGHFGHGDPAERAAWMVERASDKLDLSAEQTGKLEALVAQMQTLHEEMHEKHGSSREQLIALFAEPTLDQTAVLTMLTEKTAAVETEAPDVIAAIAEFTDSLDNTQKEEVIDLLEWHKGRRWGH